MKKEIEEDPIFKVEDINKLDQYHQTPLIFAVDKNNIRCVEKILTIENLNPNIQDKNGWTALFFACNRGNKEIVKLLLKHKNIDPNIANEFQMTPLICACDKGYIEVVESLLTHPKTDINIADDLGLTALMWASYRENRVLVKRLLQHPQIKKDFKSKKGKTASDFMTNKNIKKKLNLESYPRCELVRSPHWNRQMTVWFYQLKCMQQKVLWKTFPYIHSIKIRINRFKTKLKKIIHILNE